jgi:multimeric flavodoxin WrbA
VKAVAFCGSPRKNGNTEMMCRHALQAIEEEGVETELVRLSDYEIKGCTACDACMKVERCAVKDDLMPLYEKMKAADAVILASPVYICSATPEIKALIDRTSYISHWNGKALRGKVGGPIVVARRTGDSFTMVQLAMWYWFNDCIMCGSTYWNVAYGGHTKGDVKKDAEGFRTMWNFGKNVAYLVKKLNDVPGLGSYRDIPKLNEPQEKHS